VGLLDDDEKKHGRMLHGVRVIGALDDLPRFAQRLKLRHAIIAMPSVRYNVRRRVVEVCKRARVSVMTVPTLNNLVAGKGSPARIRKVAVEDLMKRDSVTIDDTSLHELLTGQVVMVTGAGGSIGSELCRQIAAYGPAMLVLYEMNEYAMYKVDEQLREDFPNLPVASLVGDIKNARRVNQVMHQYSPALVFQAAAYKHVPLMEEANAWEAVQNNVLGTYAVARAAIDYGVKKFVFVSTDKAVNPTNVMGATKRLAEMVCQALQAESQTRFEMVRFGNVLGSAGSVIPKFQEQIDKGGPVTVTHPEMVRYFMSIPEAAQLVLQAGSMGLGGEIFVMDMGEPVKIVDLARDMIRLSELSESEIRIVYTGVEARREALRGAARRRRAHAPHAPPEAAHRQGARGRSRLAREPARLVARLRARARGFGGAPRPEALGARIPVPGPPQAHRGAASARGLASPSRASVARAQPSSIALSAQNASALWRCRKSSVRHFTTNPESTSNPSRPRGATSSRRR
jgi:FlaA1/EpsC-like NDP-sugar epimerase